MNVTPDFRKRFLTGTDETGRFIVTSHRTGRSYYVEPITNGHRSDWGSVDPATKQLMNKKGHDKYTGAVAPSESMITAENGFDKIHMLDPGTSPHAYIEHLDAQYPSKDEAKPDEAVDAVGSKLVGM